MRIIVSHVGLPSRHIDDTIGVALLCNDYTKSRVKWRHMQVAPQDEHAIARLRARGAAFVDVGDVYDPRHGQFDHHQDAALDCAAVLVAEHLGYRPFCQSLAAVFMTAKDLRGFAAAVAETGHKPSADAAEAEMALCAVTITPQFAAWVAWNLILCQPTTTYSDLLVGLWEGAPNPVRAEWNGLRASKAATESNALASVRVIAVSGLRIGCSDTHVVPAPLAFKSLGVQVMVSVNAANAAQTSITKDTASAATANVDLSRAASAAGVKQIFLHNSGFIVVLESPAGAIDVEAVVGACLA